MFARPQMVNPEFFSQYAEIKEVAISVLNRPIPLRWVPIHHNYAEFHIWTSQVA
jgi:hypothetical protein